MKQTMGSPDRTDGRHRRGNARLDRATVLHRGVTRGKITEATSNLADMRVKPSSISRTTGLTSAPVRGTTAPLPTGAKYLPTPPRERPRRHHVHRSGGRRGPKAWVIVHTVDQGNTKATTITAGLAAAAGWTGNAACWVTNKGGVC